MPAVNDPAVAGFLHSSLIAQVATLSPKGRPFVTPLWFVVDAGALYLTTGPETRAGRNIASHPEVTLLLSGEQRLPRDRILRLRGTATRHHGLPSWRVLARIAAKYYLAPGALALELRNAGRWALRQRYYRQQPGGFGYLLVMPTGSEFLPLP